MGGIGSGRWCRWNTDTVLEETKRIDIRFMARQGYLKPDTAGRLYWTRAGEPSGDISYLTTHRELKLNFRWREQGGEWEDVEQRINFDRTPCNFGGQRMWFLCPGCGRRVAILCCDYSKFYCRQCNKLSYASQNQGDFDRLISQKNKLGERIFKYYDMGFGWEKKKGMHWKTFDRLHARYKRLDRQCNRYIAKYSEQLGER